MIRILALAAALIAFGQAALSQPAQQRGGPGRGTSLAIEAGGGRLLRLNEAATSVFAANPSIAEVRPASPTSLFVMGVAPGRTTVIATGADGQQIGQWDVIVRSAAFAESEAMQAIRRLIPGANISVESTPSGIIASGEVAQASDAQLVNAILRGFGPENRPVINRMSVRGATQVNIRVRVAEVTREISRQLGFNWQALGAPGRFRFGLRTGQAVTSPLSALGVAGSILNPGDRIGAGYTSTSWDVNGVIDALATDGLITILAEPNLTAQSGEVASFLAGGEFPIPVAQRDNNISIEFKQFGVSLAFVPTVMGPDRISVRVRPEVSELSDRGAIDLPTAFGGSLRIPALTVRRAETTVELGSGQSFAIAGLLQDQNRMTGKGLPSLSEVPILGALFKSDSFHRSESELVIIVTPYLVRPTNDPRALALPTDGFKPANDIERILYHRQIARGAPGAPVRVPGQAGFITE